MLGSTVLDVAIGLAFIYLLLSLICTVINEGISSLLNKRGENLFEGVKNLLNDPDFTGLAQQLYNHGLIDGISRYAADPDKANRPPSYMAPDTFALALLDILGVRGIAASKASYEAAVTASQAVVDAAQAKVNADPTNAAYQSALEQAKRSLAEVETALETPKKVADALDQAQKTAEEAKRSKDPEKIQAASEAFKTALAVGRSFAAAHPDPLGNLRLGIEGLPAGHTRESLLVLMDKAKRDVAVAAAEVRTVEQSVEMFQANVERWFNNAMDRVSGWYKRWTQAVLLVLALVVVVAANADTLAIAKRLARDSSLRAAVNAAADKLVQSAPTPTPTPSASPSPSPSPDAVPDPVRTALFQQAQQLNLPLGWVIAENDPYRKDQIPDTRLGVVMKIVGLLLSTVLVSLGAPFWFDTLSKFVNLRGAGTPPGQAAKSAALPDKTTGQR